MHMMSVLCSLRMHASVNNIWLHVVSNATYLPVSRRQKGPKAQHISNNSAPPVPPHTPLQASATNSTHISLLQTGRPSHACLSVNNEYNSAYVPAASNSTVQSAAALSYHAPAHAP
jgi:hypothetical protein